MKHHLQNQVLDHVAQGAAVHHPWQKREQVSSSYMLTKVPLPRLQPNSPLDSFSVPLDSSMESWRLCHGCYYCLQFFSPSSVRTCFSQDVGISPLKVQYISLPLDFVLCHIMCFGWYKEEKGQCAWKKGDMMFPPVLLGLCLLWKTMPRPASSSFKKDERPVEQSRPMAAQ